MFFYRANNSNEKWFNTKDGNAGMLVYSNYIMGQISVPVTRACNIIRYARVAR